MVQKDISGQKFNMVTAIRYVGNDKQNCPLYECVCDCGRLFITRRSSLVNGHTKSCGYHRAKTATSEERKERLFIIWRNMINRCYKTQDPAYAHYGGRGISVCAPWKNNYHEFKNWALNNGYSDSLTIDRIDNNGNYEPNNCRWADRYVQGNNTSRNRFIDYGDESLTLSQWACRLGITPSALKTRLDRWGVDQALTAPRYRRVRKN